MQELSPGLNSPGSVEAIITRRTSTSGGGAGNRATGRAACESSAVTGWRSVIDVDLVGLPDDPGKLTTSGQNIACRRLS